MHIDLLGVFSGVEEEGVGGGGVGGGGLEVKKSDKI